MSLVDQLHAAHKERMARLSPPPRDDAQINQLKSDVNKLNAELRRQKLIIAEQKQYIEKLAGVAANTNPKLEEILSCVCSYYDIATDEMRSQSRAGTIPHYRQIYYYLARQYSHSLTQIGLNIRKDHTSVLHGQRKIEGMLETDILLRGDIAELKQKIAAKVYARQKALEKYLKAEGAV